MMATVRVMLFQVLNLILHRDVILGMHLLELLQFLWLLLVLVTPVNISTVTLLDVPLDLLEVLVEAAAV
jgi:hypothetical protein